MFFFTVATVQLYKKQPSYRHKFERNILEIVFLKECIILTCAKSTHYISDLNTQSSLRNNSDIFKEIKSL